MTAATTEPNQTAEGGPRHLIPDEIGWLVKAFRDTKLTNDDWVDKTPLLCRITYLLAASKGQTADKGRGRTQGVRRILSDQEPQL